MENGTLINQCPKVHHIKEDIDFADSVLYGFKPFEIRKNDRNYSVGDYVIFHVVDKNKQLIDHPLNNEKFIITYCTNYDQKENNIVFGMIKL